MNRMRTNGSSMANGFALKASGEFLLLQVTSLHRNELTLYRQCTDMDLCCFLDKDAPSRAPSELVELLGGLIERGTSVFSRPFPVRPS